ncbi:uncharacterized protein METZ01_LOCUS440405, partial [marine metagenome]
ISDALMVIYKLVWDDFCSWYLEIIKPGYEQPLDAKTFEATNEFVEQWLKILHPFMPFITEEIWHLINQREEKDCIMVSPWPKSSSYDKNKLDAFDIAVEVVTNIRNLRIEKGIKNKESLELYINGENHDSAFDCVIKKLANLSKVLFTDEKPINAHSIIIRSTEFLIPLEHAVNNEEETKKVELELDYTRGFLNGVMKKLNNDKFVNNAPSTVIEMERKKQSDAEAKIKALKEQLEKLS